MHVLFVKRGPRVEAEAVALSAVAGHPGVVELVEAGGGVLRTVLVRDARPLADAGGLSAEEVAGVVGSVAAILADLHDAGVVHGGVDGGHVLLAADGRPVLCSLGRGGEPADDVLALGALACSLLSATAARPLVRRSPPPPGLLGRRRSTSTERAGGRRFTRRRRPQLGPMLTPDAARAVTAVLAEATAADPAARPTARALAAAIHQRVPTARLPGPVGRTKLPLAVPRPAARARRGRRRGHARPSVVRADGVAGRAGGPIAHDEDAEGGHQGRHDRSAARTPAARAAGERPPPGAGAPAEDLAAEGGHGMTPGAAGVTTAGGTRDAVGAGGGPTGLPVDPPGRPGGDISGGAPRFDRRWVPSMVTVVMTVGVVAVIALAVLPNMLRDRRSPVDPPASPTDGGTTRQSGTPPIDTPAPPPVAVRVWPPEPLDFRDGVLTVADARYTLGRPGDAVVAGDWACAGHETLVLLRPGTGEVFAFDEWPAEDQAATARPLAEVAGATEVRVVDGDGDGCDDLEVLRPGTPPVRLDPAA